MRSNKQARTCIPTNRLLEFSQIMTTTARVNHNCYNISLCFFTTAAFRRRRREDGAVDVTAQSPEMACILADVKVYSGLYRLDHTPD